MHLAALALGAVVLPLNPGYRPEEIAYFLFDSETNLLVTYQEKYDELKKGLIGFPDIPVLSIDGECPNCVSYDRLLDQNPRRHGSPLSHFGGGPRPPLLHLRHHRPLQGGHDHPRQPDPQSAGPAPGLAVVGSGISSCMRCPCFIFTDWWWPCTVVSWPGPR